MPAVDKFALKTQAQSSILMPPENDFAIVPDDSNDLLVVTRAIYVGVAGDIIAHMVGNAAGDNRLYKNAQAGSVIIGRFDRVLATGTSATNLVGQW